MYTYDYDSLPQITKDFIDGKFLITIESQEDADILHNYFNANLIGWYSNEISFDCIQLNTLRDIFRHNYYLCYGINGFKRGVCYCEHCLGKVVSSDEFLKEINGIKMLHEINLIDWESII